MTCYFQGCSDQGVTKERIPPRSLFPEGEKAQLLTNSSFRIGVWLAIVLNSSTGAVAGGSGKALPQHRLPGLIPH